MSSNALVNVNPQDPPCRQTQEIMTFDNFSCQCPHAHLCLCIRIPPFPYPRGGNHLILNIRTAPASEQYCHNPLGLMSESCQNPLVAHRDGGGVLGNHTDWCINFNQRRSMSPNKSLPL